MPLKRTGLQTIDLPLRPAVCASAAFVGKKEGEGPLGNLFDHVAQDELYGQDTFELAEKRLYLDAIRKAIQKGGLKPENVQFLLGGDLLNQIITASFSARELGIPFIGLYGACSTMAESLCLGSMLLDGEHASTVVCAASSHFCTAERQYRYPLEFGSQRPPTAQWTVTGAGAVLLTLQPPVPPQARVTRVCMGRVVDLGVNDANNMGAAMAPAAADTLLALLADTHTQPADYDLIVTGDLGQVGRDLLLQLMREQRMPLDERLHRDCGLMIYDRERQDAHAGGRLRMQRLGAVRQPSARPPAGRSQAHHLYGHGRADERDQQPAGRNHPRHRPRCRAGVPQAIKKPGGKSMSVLWMYLKVFLVGGALCAVGELLVLRTRLTPARILVCYIIAGVLLSAIGVYGPLADFAGAGATVPLTGFGHALCQGVMGAVDEIGLIGAFTGGLSATAGGIAAAVFFGTLIALAFKPRAK